MNIIDKFLNNKLRFKEKFGNSYYRQLLRLGKVMIKSPGASFKNGTLFKVMIGLTYECQCSCEYCCSGLYAKESKKELTTEEIRSLINDISRLPFAVVLVSFFGGEPLIRKDVFDLVRYAAAKGLFVELETNGILLSLENVKRLKAAGLHHLFVRIEHCEAAFHDKISNFQGCFKKTIEGIGYCVREKLPCSISTIAMKDKIHNNQIEKIIELGKRLKVTSLRILYPTLAGRWLDKDEEILTEAEEKAVRELLNPDFVYLESSYVCTKEMNRICPSRHKKMFYVSCYGEVQPCPFTPLNFGNIRDKKIKEILNKMWEYFIFRDKKYNGCLMGNKEIRDNYIKSNKTKSLFPMDIK